MDSNIEAPRASAAGAVSSALVALLRCPETLQPVALAPAALMERVAVAGLRDRSGAPAVPLASALLRADGELLFPIRNGIPMMLSGLAIAVPREMR